MTTLLNGLGSKTQPEIIHGSSHTDHGHIHERIEKARDQVCLNHQPEEPYDFNSKNMINIILNRGSDSNQLSINLLLGKEEYCVRVSQEPGSFD